MNIMNFYSAFTMNIMNFCLFLSWTEWKIVINEDLEKTR